ncbi:hypothetical protein LINPERHAP1_LOCUS5982 [Linum perenne]
MVESRRRAERAAEYAARNTSPCNNFEYSVVVNKAAAQSISWTPSLVEKYRIARLGKYKLHGNERLDDSVVKVEPQDDIVSCDCRWWDTIAILCWHSLTVMHMLAMFGNEKFKMLDQRYIKSQWKRRAKRNLVSLIIPRPITRGEEEEQRYTKIFAKFGFIIPAALSIIEVSEMVDATDDALAEQVQQVLALYEAPR